MRNTAIASVVVVVLGSASLGAQQPTNALPPKANPFGDLFRAPAEKGLSLRFVMPKASLDSKPTAPKAAVVCGMTLIPADPKNDAAFKVYEWLHHVLAYTLLGVAALHVLGVLKHRFLDRTPENDVLRRMLC